MWNLSSYSVSNWIFARRSRRPSEDCISGVLSIPLLIPDEKSATTPQNVKKMWSSPPSPSSLHFPASPPLLPPWRFTNYSISPRIKVYIFIAAESCTRFLQNIHNIMYICICIHGYSVYTHKQAWDSYRELDALINMQFIRTAYIPNMLRIAMPWCSLIYGTIRMVTSQGTNKFHNFYQSIESPKKASSKRLYISE